MSNEKIGAIKTSTNLVSNIITYSRVHRGINLPYDFMSKEERQMLNGEVVTYHIDEVKNHVRNMDNERWNGNKN